MVTAVRNGAAKIQRKERQHTISQEVKTQIREYYLDEKNSKILPGIKDTVSVKTPDGRIKQRKQLLLSTIENAYKQFIEDTGTTVSLESFRKLRPKNVVLITSAGVHSICCCVLCENPKLIISTSILGKNYHN